LAQFYRKRAAATHIGAPLFRVSKGARACKFCGTRQAHSRQKGPRRARDRPSYGAGARRCGEI